jgi:rod shape-determining protein MreC
VNLKRYRDFVIVVLALAVPFWFLRANMREQKPASGPDRVVMAVSAPLQSVVAMAARGVSSLWGDYVYLVHVKDDNAKLVAQNARLRDRVRRLESLEEENRRLRRLLELKASVRTDVVSAQIVGKNTNDFFRVTRVTLDRSVKNVQPNLAVISPEGVVGTTMKGAGDTLDVRLVVDGGFNVDAVVQRTGARAFVRGTGDERRYNCRVEYVLRTDEVEVGDLLVTSGFGRRFPRGIPIATVTEVQKRDFGVYQSVEAQPVVDFSRVSEVLIVTTPPPDVPPPEPPPKGKK